MRTLLQVLSENEQVQVHERTLKILANTGVRVDTAQGRQYLYEAGGQVDVDTNIVRFPPTLVEGALQQTPKDFTLGARRPGWDLPMNAGNCLLLADGEATTVIDRQTGKHRPSTFKDWSEVTRLLDALDEIGIYWAMIERTDREGTLADQVEYWRALFANFSKHVQDASPGVEDSGWLLEVLQVVFGDKETIKERHPFSFLLCPQSPLVIDQHYTEAYLATLGWDIPVAAMPMPLMGGTAPGSLIASIIQANCEVLSMLCLVQAAAPGTPFIYAPATSTMNPRTGMLSSGAIENGLFGAATTEMGRFYSLPVESSGGGTDHYMPGIQNAYERALNAFLPVLTWPDILVGPGLMGGSMILSFEQLLIDVEVFKMSKRAHLGISTGEGKWLDEVVARVGPAGNFLSERSTVAGIRQGEWYMSQLGFHEPIRLREAEKRSSLLDEAKDKVEEILKSHRPIPLDEDVERELDRIQKRAQETVES
jgi:trimethylamine--corrinoid protein Co-methyltransferase